MIRLCRMLEVWRSGYYEWLARPSNTQAEADRQFQEKVQHYFAQGRGAYGTRHIKRLLAQEDYRSAVAALGACRAQVGLRCKTRLKFKAPRLQARPSGAPNQLNREFTVPEPDTIYVGI